MRLIEVLALYTLDISIDTRLLDSRIRAVD